MSRLPLRVRLALAFAGAMAALLAVTGAFLYVRLGNTLDDQIDQSLRARADDVAVLVARSGSGLSLAARLTEGEESFAQVLSPSGRVLDVTPPLDRTPLLSPEQVARARTDTFFVEHDPLRGLDTGRIRLLATPVDAGGRRYVIVSGASLQDRDEALTALRRQLLIGGPIALLLASFAGYLLAGAALRPVESIRRRAEEISATVAGRRLPVPEADDEVGRLARTLNEMLARIEEGVERERRFVAEASHELRTPLALLKTELELALRHPRSAEELRAAIASAAQETDRLTVLAEDLLVLARSDEGQLRLDSKPLRARDLLDTVAHRFERRAEDAGLALEVEAPPELTAIGDPVRLEQALGNVVDNAVRYGAGTVRLEARRQNGAVELSVSDQGAGFDPEFLPHAFERFSRDDGGRVRGSTGLGLAIVAAVARAHGGTAAARNAAGGGAEVTLVLPA